jgi:hypothetical protein
MHIQAYTHTETHKYRCENMHTDTLDTDTPPYTLGMHTDTPRTHRNADTHIETKTKYT